MIDSFEIALQVYPIFEENGWRYGNSTGDTASVSEIAGMVDHLVDTVRSNPKYTRVSSGRFEVTRPHEDSPDHLVVSLIVGQDEWV